MRCLICLSEDRTLSPTNKLRTLIRNANLPELTKLKGSICWECIAILQKITKFQKVVKKVQDVQHARVVTEAQRQSTLGQSQIKTLDDAIHLEYEPIKALRFTKVNTLEDAIHIVYEDPIKIEVDNNDSYFTLELEECEVFEQIEENITKQEIEIQNDDPLSSEDTKYNCSLCHFVTPNEETLIRHISSNCETTKDNTEIQNDSNKNAKRKHKDETSNLSEIGPKSGRSVRKRHKNTESVFGDPETSEISENECFSNVDDDKSATNAASRKSRKRRLNLDRSTRIKGSHLPEDMKTAVTLYLKGSSLRKVASKCKIPYSTLRRYAVKYSNDPGATMEPNYSVNRVFTNTQEIVLKQYIIDYAKENGMARVTGKICRQLALQMADANDIKYPLNWKDNGMAGVEWYRGFKSRHPDICIQESCDTGPNTAILNNDKGG